MLGAVKDFHGIVAKYTDFVIKDVAQKYNLDYKELCERYIAKCSRSVRSRSIIGNANSAKSLANKPGMRVDVNR